MHFRTKSLAQVMLSSRWLKPLLSWVKWFVIVIQEQEFSSTFKSCFFSSGKTKEFYKAKSAELEKLKRESPSPKELEKAETKFRKAQVSSLWLCDIDYVFGEFPDTISIRMITRPCATSTQTWGRILRKRCSVPANISSRQRRCTWRRFSKSLIFLGEILNLGLGCDYLL